MIKCFFENGKGAFLRHAVVNVIIVKNNKILLQKRSEKIIEGGKWGLAGGFMEKNETIKKAAEREVFEETGYRINNLTLLTIIDKPNRLNDADRQSIAFVFFCEAGEKQGKSDWEATEQKWFTFDSLPKKEDFAFDHLEFIEIYLKYKKENLPLPILN